jgi:hypothetical protein
MDKPAGGRQPCISHGVPLIQEEDGTTSPDSDVQIHEVKSSDDVDPPGEEYLVVAQSAAIDGAK